MEGKGKASAPQFEIALFASTSATTVGIQAAWYSIKVPDLKGNKVRIFFQKVTTIEKPLCSFSSIETQNEHTIENPLRPFSSIETQKEHTIEKSLRPFSWIETKRDSGCYVPNLRCLPSVTNFENPLCPSSSIETKKEHIIENCPFSSIETQEVLTIENQLRPFSWIETQKQFTREKPLHPFSWIETKGDSGCYVLRIVTTIEKPLRPFSEVWLACAYGEHVVIGSRLYSLGGMNPDSEPFAGVTTPEFARFLKVRSLELSTPYEGWKPIATMTFPKRFQPPCLVLDDKLYVLGVVSASEVEEKGYGWMEVYDPDSNTWEPLPNPPPGFSLSAPFPAYYVTFDSKKQILVAQHEEGASLLATFYVYHVIDRCWTLLEPPKRKLRPYYHDPVRGRRSTIVDNTIYGGFVLDGFVRVQSHNIDTDLYFHGCVDTKPFFEDGEFADEYRPKLPLLHVADQTFCLLMFTFVDNKMEKEDNDIELFEDNGIIYLNCIVLDISLNPFKDEGKRKSKEEFDEIYKYHFMGDSSKQLNISIVCVQKYPVRNGSFWLNDAVLLDCPTYMPMKKKPKSSHETSVMIKDN